MAHVSLCLPIHPRPPLLTCLAVRVHARVQVVLLELEGLILDSQKGNLSKVNAVFDLQQLEENGPFNLQPIPVRISPDKKTISWGTVNCATGNRLCLSHARTSTPGGCSCSVGAQVPTRNLFCLRAMSIW